MPIFQLTNRSNQSNIIIVRARCLNCARRVASVHGKDFALWSSNELSSNELLRNSGYPEEGAEAVLDER